MTLLAILTLGFFLGVRHATDADHVVAVTTIVSRERRVRGSLLIGLLWGLGHTLTILLVGGAVIAFGLVIPPRLGLSMEMSVAVMLLVLGIMNVTGTLRHIRATAAGANAEPAAGGPTEPTGRFRVLRGGLRPLFVGIVHGLAGSAAVALLVLATVRDVAWAFVYLVVFGAGTMAGMSLLTVAMSLPLLSASKRFGNFDRLMTRATGFVSIAFGLFLAYQIGFVDGLFLENPSFNPH